MFSREHEYCCIVLPGAQILLNRAPGSTRQAQRIWCAGLRFGASCSSCGAGRPATEFRDFFVPEIENGSRPYKPTAKPFIENKAMASFGQKTVDQVLFAGRRTDQLRREADERERVSHLMSAVSLFVALLLFQPIALPESRRLSAFGPVSMRWHVSAALTGICADRLAADPQVAPVEYCRRSCENT